MKESTIKLWKDMAELTKKKCMETCHSKKMTGKIGGCCSPEYCQMAKEMALEKGITLPETDNKLLIYCGPDGCTIEPHFRQLCTLHQCKINGIGFDSKDPKWTKKYFKLRNKLEILMEEDYAKRKT